MAQYKPLLTVRNCGSATQRRFWQRGTSNIDLQVSESDPIQRDTEWTERSPGLYAVVTRTTPSHSNSYNGWYR